METWGWRGEEEVVVSQHLSPWAYNVLICYCQLMCLNKCARPSKCRMDVLQSISLGPSIGRMDVFQSISLGPLKHTNDVP